MRSCIWSRIWHIANAALLEHTTKGTFSRFPGGDPWSFRMTKSKSDKERGREIRMRQLSLQWVREARGLSGARKGKKFRKSRM